MKTSLARSSLRMTLAACRSSGPATPDEAEVAALLPMRRGTGVAILGIELRCSRDPTFISGNDALVPTIPALRSAAAADSTAAATSSLAGLRPQELWEKEPTLRQLHSTIVAGLRVGQHRKRQSDVLDRAGDRANRVPLAYHVWCFGQMTLLSECGRRWVSIQTRRKMQQEYGCCLRKSEPMPSGDPPEAISDASPPELPPAERSGFQGLRVNPKTRFVVSVEELMSGQFVFPNTIAPAALRRRTASASVPAMLSR
jgi:hypothetical protein